MWHPSRRVRDTRLRPIDNTSEHAAVQSSEKTARSASHHHGSGAEWWSSRCAMNQMKAAGVGASSDGVLCRVPDLCETLGDATAAASCKQTAPTTSSNGASGDADEISHRAIAA